MGFWPIRARVGFYIYYKIILLSIHVFTSPIWLILIDRCQMTMTSKQFCATRSASGPHFTSWIIAFYTFHSLLLIFGLFLAFETRKVSISALNDSRFIGISVYNVVLLSAIGVPVSFLTNSHPTVSFLLVCTVILFCTTLTLGILFVPKVRLLQVQLIVGFEVLFEILMFPF